jgi:hypothetical protein
LREAQRFAGLERSPAYFLPTEAKRLEPTGHVQRLSDDQHYLIVRESLFRPNLGDRNVSAEETNINA